MKVVEAIAAAGIEAREARLLLAEVCGFSQASLMASPEQEIPFEVENAFFEFTRRRTLGEPVAYILGRKEFYGIELSVNPSVLIPRPETELLVELALERRPASALDLGTGSGAIAIAVKYNMPETRVVAVDSDLSALVTAKRNAVRLNLEIDFRHGRWFDPVAGERFGLIVSNPPYVASGDPHHAPADRHRGRMPGFALAAQEPRARDVGSRGAHQGQAGEGTRGKDGVKAQIADRFGRPVGTHPHL